ncbi:MAG: NADH-quinone oxidoreductase subunit NuoE [Saezia sp.]
MQKQNKTKQPFQLSARELEVIAHEMSHYEDSRAASIGALKAVQEERGWVPDEALEAIAQVINIPASDVEEVATFYSQIYRQPVGRHVVKYCDSMVCYMTGYASLEALLEEKLKIKPGQTTEDGRFTLLPVCCLGNCDKAPSIMIDNDTYGHVTPEMIEQLLERYL